jgi:hypothetical protein
MNRIIAMEETPRGLLLNFGAPRREFKKKFRLRKTESISL